MNNGAYKDHMLQRLRQNLSDTELLEFADSLVGAENRVAQVVITFTHLTGISFWGRQFRFYLSEDETIGSAINRALSKLNKDYKVIAKRINNITAGFPTNANINTHVSGGHIYYVEADVETNTRVDE